jgi:membrane fusion protein, heavy metal efflux system
VTIDASVPPQPQSGSPARGAPSRSTPWGIVVAAFLGGVVTTAIVTTVVMRGRDLHRATADSSYKIDGDKLVLAPNAVPMKFETSPVELGAPLPRSPVTARVTTVEARTGPSFAPLDGRVVEVAVRIGDHVKQGDRLVMVRSGDLASMERELHAAQLAIQTKQALSDRMKLLVESRAASQNDLMVAQGELAEAKLTAAAADAKLRSLTVREAGETAFWVLATRSGTVVQIDAVPGKQVGPDKDHPIATVADLDEVLVVSDVPQSEASTLGVGMEVVVQPPANGEPLPGFIESVSDMLDPERQTVPIRIRVKNEGHRLRPHEFVKTEFAPSKTDRLLLVPADAVVSDGSVSVVFVEVAPGVLRRRNVRLGRQTKERTEILSGVAEGERVVTRGALLLLNAIDIKG